MSLVLQTAITDINRRFHAVGDKREYSFTDTDGLNLFVTAGSGRTTIGEGYNLADAVADLYGDAFRAMHECAYSLQRDADNPSPTRVMYEIIRDLTQVAVDGVESRRAEEACFADRLNTEAGQYAVARGQTFLDHYSDAYHGGDLK